MADVETPEVEQEVEGAIDALIDEESQEEEPEEEAPGEEEAPKTPTVEELAQELGWKPQDDFQGHEDDYVGPDEYIRRSKDIQTSMRTHLKENKRKLASMEGALRDIKVHYEANTKAQAVKHEEQLVELRQQRIEAIEEGDAARVDAVENKMAKLYETTSEQPREEVKVNPEEEEAFDDWMAENPWYSKGGNREMMKYADDLADLPENRVLPYARKLKFVTEKVKEAFPESFKTTPKAAPNPVEAPSRGSGKRRYSSRDLNPEQKTVMRNLVANKMMTEKQYIADLVAQGEI